MMLFCYLATKMQLKTSETSRELSVCIKTQMRERESGANSVSQI